MCHVYRSIYYLVCVFDLYDQISFSFSPVLLGHCNLVSCEKIGVRLRSNCGNIFGKQVGNVFVFTICFDVGLAVLC